jgi:hypothetical protein
VGVDKKPGIGASKDLNEYYLTGEGSGWQLSPKPWTTLRNRLLQFMSIAKANGLATDYFFLHFGYYPGSKEHRNRGGK